MINPLKAILASSPVLEKNDTIADILSSGVVVPNVHPTLTAQYRIALIGEAPGGEEEKLGKPFVGMSGKLLNGLLDKAKVMRDACFVGNICQVRPPSNNIAAFDFNGTEIQSGLAQLKIDLDKFQPNICVLFGNAVLKAAKGVYGIGDWRGSLFVGDQQGAFYGRKCIAAYHPAACLRQYEWTPLLMFDLKKAAVEGSSPTLILPQRELLHSLPFELLISELDKIINGEYKIQQTNTEVSPDIEGGIGTMSCCSFAVSPTKSILVPFCNLDGSNFWQNPDEEVEVWKRFVAILTDPKIKKCFQNGLYDRFVLQYSYNIVSQGCKDDTMLKFWELYCELEKGLGAQSSILTREPYWKFERKSGNRETHFAYCCKDSAVTYEINKELDKYLFPASRLHYQFNHDLLNPLLYMELRGIKYDAKLAKDRLKEVNSHIATLQAQLDRLAGVGITVETTKEQLAELIRETCCYKRDKTTPKKEFEDCFQRLLELLKKAEPFTQEEIGYINIECGWSMNVKSAAFKVFLYTKLGLPKQYKTDPNTGREALSTNYESLLKIQKKQPHQAVTLALDIGELRTRSQMLAIHADKDGRIRCGYNIVGTETGRLTCYTSPTGSGYNLQTIPAESPTKEIGHPLRNGMRDLFVADEGYYLFQCDLSGADGWTVAAHLANLGDPTMLDDYRAGIKPAKVLCYLLRHGVASLQGKTRQEIKELTKSIEKESWDYFLSKIGQHGTCYLMGPRKLADQAFIQSEGKVTVTESTTRELQQLFTIRYRIKLWHDWMKRQLDKKPELISASGHKRRFFGRYTDVLGQALAHEPQANTTYATNLAAWRLWTDAENRTRVSAKTILCIEPLHQVHDALLGQFKITDTTWAVGKIKSYFSNPIQIAGQTITIPFEGSYGKNWALDEKSKVGNI